MLNDYTGLIFPPHTHSQDMIYRQRAVYCPEIHDNNANFQRSA